MAALTTRKLELLAMAISANSTPMPAPQRGLLRAFAHPRDLVANHREMPGSCLPPAPEDPLASTGIAALLEPPEAAEVRGLHSRRRLTEALEHGFALLDALDLPPLALDVIDDAIAHLDALDAPREDLEPSLGWTESGPRFCGDYQDCELDTADADAVNEDAEEDDPAEETSLETAGRGFIPCGADDAEDDDGCERGEEYGSDDGEDIGHHASQVTPRPLTPAERAEVAVMAARAATIRRALHV